MATLSAAGSMTSGVAVGPSPPPPAVTPVLRPLELAISESAAGQAVSTVVTPADTVDCADPNASCAPRTTIPAPQPMEPDSACRLRSDHAPAGTTHPVPVTAPRTVEGRVLRYQVEVEDGLAIDDGCFASLIDSILNDPQGWGGDGSISFHQVESRADFRLILASPDTTDRLCYPLRTAGKYSCRSRRGVILNLMRWESGTADYAGNLATYREYLVNHEVGHLLGHGHIACPGPGEPAPVMMQQTKGIDGCLLNGWPTADER